MEYNVLSLTFFMGLVTSCVLAAGELNDPCTHFGDCRDFGYLCGKNRTCQCLQPSYVPNKLRNKCVGIINQKCKYDEHCIDGAFCMNQTKCQCKDDLVPSDDKTTCSHSIRVTPQQFVVLLPVAIILYLKLCLWLP